MSQENKSLIRTFVEAINAQDWLRLLATLTSDFTRHSTAAGETATLRVGAPHSQWNPCDSEAVVIEELRPAGRVHNFFKVLFGLARDGRTDGNGYPPPVLAAALFSEFRDTILPAPLGSRLWIALLGPVALVALGYRRRIEQYLHGRWAD